MARILTIVVAILAVVGAAFYVQSSKGDDGGGAQSSATREPGKNAVTIDMVVSPEKEELLKPLAAQFNAEQKGEKPAFIKLRAGNSGDIEAAIGRGGEKPDARARA